MNKKTRTKRNLAICIMMAIVGALTLWLSYALVDFRIFDGGYIKQANDWTKGFSVIVIMCLELGTGLLGVVFLILGTIGTYNNARKMMR